MLEKKDIQDLFRKLELAAQEGDQAAQEARAQLARVEALLSRPGEWRRALKKKSSAAMHFELEGFLTMLLLGQMGSALCSFATW